MKEKRSNFTSKIGFVMAAAGSAVGLGNIWRFPYLAARYGGGTFLLVYLLLAITFGFSVMITEIAIGRKTGKSAIEAFKSLDKRFAFLGVLSAVVPAMIIPYYSVIGGWVTKYVTVYLTGISADAAQDGFFKAYVGKPAEPVLWLAVFVVVTALVVICGVQKGIEKVSTVLMPALVALSIVIAVYAVSLPGAWEGVLYYITPDLSKLSGMTVLAALGQLFYSMSLAMGIMVTYGSYMKKSDDLESSVHQIEIFDTGVAFLAGLMIVPSVYAFSGGDETALNEGTGLMFVTLPKVFESMPAGKLIGAAFFIMVFFAALTSAISLMETVTSIVCDKTGWGRKKTTVLVAAACLILGVPFSLGEGVWKDIRIIGMTFLDFFDFLSNSVLMPVVAICTCVLIGFVVGPKLVIREVEENGVVFKSKKIYGFIIKYIAPVGILAILVSSVISALGVFKW